MQVYLICPVRRADPAARPLVESYVSGLEAAGHRVHFPPRDVDQEDPTGEAICAAHFAAMRAADEVHVFWDRTSSGSHFDLGMAYALGKPVVVAHLFQEDGPGKSYVKVMQGMRGGREA